MVGKLLSPRRIHVSSFKERVVAIWRPGRGIFVQEQDDRQFLFKFFHEYDISRVLEGGPWIYDNMYILLHRLMPNKAPAAIPLDSLDFWVQIHNLPVGFMFTQVKKQTLWANLFNMIRLTIQGLGPLICGLRFELMFRSH